jgi:hypothetical protein
MSQFADVLLDPQRWLMAGIDAEGRRNFLLVLAGLLLLIALYVYWPSTQNAASLEELAHLATEASTPEEQEQAAVELASRGKPAVEFLRDVLAKSQSPEVRVACIDGLGTNWDYDSMDSILDAMEDSSPLVRGRAGAVACRMIGRERPFHASDSEEKRQQIVEFMRADWKAMREAGTLEKLKKELISRGN